MKVVTPSQEHELRRIRAGLKEILAITDTKDCDEKLRKRIAYYANEESGQLSRRLKQFESNIIVVVALGMLKAGKSTLINLLARTPLASPVGYGVDTTLRPALIKMAEKGEYDDKGQITIYYNTSGDETSALNELMDKLRGLKGKQSSLNPKPVPLTEENLNKVLCRKAGVGYGNLLDQEPLLVVVEVPYNEDSVLLQDKRMLLDMPGLDSANAAISLAQATHEVSEGFFSGEEEDNNIACLISRYEAVIRECDLMLFVQSSVAPLNEKASDMLRRILAIRDSASSYIVQNAMRARYWRTEGSQNAEQEKQGLYASNLIKSMFSKLRMKKTGSNIIPKTASVNLGMAYDSLFTHDEVIDPARPLTDGSPISKANLLARSEFIELEKNLYNILKNNGTSSRFIHCRQELQNEISGAIGDLSAQITEKKAAYDEAEEKRQRWEGEKNTAESKLYKSVRKIERSGAVTVENKPNFAKSAAKAKNQVTEMRDAKLSIVKANEYLARFKKECYKESAAFLSRVTLGDILIPQTGDGKTARGELGTVFCNDIIADVFEGLNVYHEEALQLNHPRWKVNAETSILNFAATPPDGTRKTEPAVENIVPLDTGNAIATFFHWNDITPGDAELEEKEQSYKNAFSDMIDRFVNSHIDEALKSIVNQALKKGSRTYMDKLNSVLQKQQDSCEKLQKELELRRTIKSKLEDFRRIASSLHL